MAASMKGFAWSPLKRLILAKTCVQTRQFWCSLAENNLRELGSKTYSFRHLCVGYGTNNFSAKLQKGFSSATRHWEINTNVAKDVLLYVHDNRSFFRIVNFFAFSQVVFWGYLAHFSYTTLRDAPIQAQVAQQNADEEIAHASDPEDHLETPTTTASRWRWWEYVNLGENKYRIGITIMCCTIGYVIFAGSTLFTMRTVKSLTLLQGGQKVQMVCYSPWRSSRVLTATLDNLSCHVGREHAKSYLPIKVKGYWMYFLLDTSGTFPNPKLFDHTAGGYRSWVQKK